MKTICIILVDYKNKKDTTACITSLEHLEAKNSKIHIVVVNNDPDTTYEKNTFSSSYSLDVINNARNTGFAGGVNTGISYAVSKQADYILLLNTDTIVDKHLVTYLQDTLNDNSSIGIVSPKIYFAKGFEFHKEKYEKDQLGKVFWYAGGIMDWKNVLGKHRGVDEVDTGQYETAEETDFATGCCMMIKSEVIKEIGDFDARYFLYYEDSDFNERVKKRGYKVYYVPKAVVWHKNAGSTGGSGSLLQDYYISRNRMLFGIHYAPIRSKIALLKESLQLLVNGRPWQKIGIKDYYLRNFGKGSFAIK